MGSKIAEFLEADRLVSKGDEGLKGVVERAGKAGERGAEAIGLLEKLGGYMKKLGETAGFSAQAEAENLGRVFESATREKNFERLATEIENYNNLINSTKLEAVESKISGLTDVTAREALSNNEAFMDSFINSGGEGSKIELSTLNSSNLFGDLNGEGFAKELNKPESGLGQLIGKEDAAERIKEFKERYPDGVGGNTRYETEYEKRIRDIYTDRGGKYGNLYNDENVMNKLKINDSAERELLANTMGGINDLDEMELFLKRIGKGDKIEDAAKYARENKTWLDSFKNLVKRNPKKSILVGTVLTGATLVISSYEYFKDDPKCDKSKAHCKKNCCGDEDSLVGDFKEGADPKSETCKDCVINNSDVGGVCANRRKFIENEQPPSPIKDEGISYFTYDTLDIKKWPEDCQQRINNNNEKECWMDKNFQTYKGDLTDTNYKYPTNENKIWRWPSHALKLKDCKSCMGEIKHYDVANVYSYYNCESSNLIDDIINKILGWMTCSKKILFWVLLIIGVLLLLVGFLKGLKSLGGRILLYLLPFLLWSGYTLYCIIPIIYNMYNIFKGKCTDEPVENEDKKNLIEKIKGILDGSDDDGEKISKGRGGLVISYVFFWPMIVVQICIFAYLLYRWLWPKKTDGKKPNEDEIEHVANPYADEDQQGGSRENKAFDVKNINRCTKGLIILSLIVAILITYFYKKNKENTIKKQYLNEIKKERSSRIENIKQMREKEKRDKEKRAEEERAKLEANQGSFISNNIFGGQFI